MRAFFISQENATTMNSSNTFDKPPQRLTHEAIATQRVLPLFKELAQHAHLMAPHEMDPLQDTRGLLSENWRVLGRNLSNVVIYCHRAGSTLDTSGDEDDQS